MAKKGKAKGKAKEVVVEEVKEVKEVASKAAIVEMVAETSEYTKQAIKEVTGEFFDKMTSILGEGKAVSIYGLGTFSVKDTAPRVGRNPRTGEAINIPAGKRISFKPSSMVKGALKEAV